MSIRSITAAAVCTATTLASAAVVLDPATDTAMQDFEGLAAGQRVTTIDFGSVTAAVTHNGRTNGLYSVHDGYGAVAADGQMFWKLAGGTATLDFGDAELTAFGFWYSDLEWATLRVTAGSRVVDLTDSNSRRPKRFDIAAVEGETFSTVSLEFIGHQNDGIGFDGLSIQSLDVPAPAGVAALGLATLAASRRRRD